MSCICFSNIASNVSHVENRALNQRDTLLQRADFPLEGRILEIGCGDGALVKLIASKDKCVEVSGIDISCSPGECTCGADAWSIQHGDAMDLDFPSAHFDSAYSFGCFEHISCTGQALNEVYRVLKPGGRVYLQFWPIWTSVIGHHSNFWVPEKVTDIPPWGHLYLSPLELKDHLLLNYPLEEVERTIDDVYFSPRINRTGFRQQVLNFLTSPFRSVSLEKIQSSCREFSFGERKDEFSNLPPKVKERLLESYDETELTTLGLMVRLIK
jgi:ubiquinone/menaquinone biosynthesis C-methylase UbiE